jgi:hypothetical protein
MFWHGYLAFMKSRLLCKVVSADSTKQLQNLLIYLRRSGWAVPAAALPAAIHLLAVYRGRIECRGHHTPPNQSHGNGYLYLRLVGRTLSARKKSPSVRRNSFPEFDTYSDTSRSSMGFAVQIAIQVVQLTFTRREESTTTNHTQRSPNPHELGTSSSTIPFMHLMLDPMKMDPGILNTTVTGEGWRWHQRACLSIAKTSNLIYFGCNKLFERQTQHLVPPTENSIPLLPVRIDLPQGRI